MTMRVLLLGLVLLIAGCSGSSTSSGGGAPAQSSAPTEVWQGAFEQVGEGIRVELAIDGDHAIGRGVLVRDGETVVFAARGTVDPDRRMARLVLSNDEDGDGETFLLVGDLAPGGAARLSDPGQADTRFAFEASQSEPDFRHYDVLVIPDDPAHARVNIRIAFSHEWRSDRPIGPQGDTTGSVYPTSPPGSHTRTLLLTAYKRVGGTLKSVVVGYLRFGSERGNEPRDLAPNSYLTLPGFTTSNTGPKYLAGPGSVVRPIDSP